MKQSENKRWGIDALTLKLLAMAFMLLDHTWATVWSVPWFTMIGRLAFPIFAFQIVEGFYHTSDRKRYMKRMALFALLSEIPFNLMVSDSLIYPFHQNVMLTFLIALLLMNFSKTGKTVDESRAWLKRIIITWAILNSLGFIMAYVTPFFQGGQWTP